MKLHLDLRYSSKVSGSYKLDSAGLMQATGGNLGNLIFRHALGSVLADFEEYVPVSWADTRELSKRADPNHIIISAANWLGSSAEDERRNLGRSQIVETLDCPIAVFGLGVQAPTGASEVTFGPNTIRFAKALANKSALIGVRDELTARSLRQIGISNVTITGCPSNFINLNPALGVEIARKAAELANAVDAWEDLRILISEIGTSDLKRSKIGSTVANFIVNYSSFYVIQSPNLLDFLLGADRSLPLGYRGADMPRSENVFRRALLSRALCFASVDAWLDFCRTCSISFGSRIHGTMVSLQAGIPSLLLGHDARTEGLGGVMGLPMLREDDFLASYSESPKKMFRLIAEQMAGFDGRRSLLGSRMMAQLRRSGLKAHPAFLEYCSYPFQ